MAIISPHASDDLAELLNGFDQWISLERRMAPRSVEAYRRDIRSFLAFLSDYRGRLVEATDLSELDVRDFRSWLASRHGQGLAKSSTARAMAALRTLFRYLDRYHKIHNPALLAMRAPKFRRPLPRPLDADQALELAEAAGDSTDGSPGETGEWTAKRDRALLLLLYGAGLRIGEALSLTPRIWLSQIWLSQIWLPQIWPEQDQGPPIN